MTDVLSPAQVQAMEAEAASGVFPLPTDAIALARSHEQLRGELDDAKVKAMLDEGRILSLERAYDSVAAEREAAVRAGGEAAAALRTLASEHYDETTRRFAREALAVLEPDGERQADLRRLRDPHIPPDIREAFAEQLLEDAASLHTEATQQEAST